MGVPDTTTFNLQNVVDVIDEDDNLVGCFNDAVAAKFDATYSGAKDNLLNFRNYDAPPVIISITMSSGSTKDVCNETANITRYTNGSDSTGPAVGDIVYTNSSGTAFLSSGNYKSQTGSSGSNVQIGSNGVCTARTGC
tara:strand:+ start:606 stop:1019 length:414 start_codon:yes stop_codon:yes gene_type:complete